MMGIEKYLSKEPTLDRKYYGIHIDGSGRNRKFWQDIVFEDFIEAEFFFEQEIFSLPEDQVPERFCVANVHHWEVEDKDLKLYKLPETVKLIFGDFGLLNSMAVTLQLQANDMPNIYYSSTWCILANSHWLESDEIVGNDTQTFGVRLRPGYSAPDRKRYISMRGEGLPGLWYVTIGMKKEVEVFPMFDEDEVSLCVICPHRPRRKSIA